MYRTLSQQLRFDVVSAVERAVRLNGVVNVPVLAEAVRLRNEPENVAREDIEGLVVQHAQALGAAMVFSSEDYLDHGQTPVGMFG
ncbi:hypothetical protein [Mesorhizobium australicum]|uniref:Uncharacterized protein n=1 Tax=Mesorhizobium australicum TaxID=536018 RepID=A0A1X7Q0Z4_9HYPH|nr:hypothetical protein [Mesorhizobium australicum]SMH57410.1 hypothetical protein SAMN02982922_5783 [Mesorhizobium australicum]